MPAGVTFSQTPGVPTTVPASGGGDVPVLELVVEAPPEPIVDEPEGPEAAAAPPAAEGSGVSPELEHALSASVRVAISRVEGRLTWGEWPMAPNPVKEPYTPCRARVAWEARVVDRVCRDRYPAPRLQLRGAGLHRQALWPRPGRLPRRLGVRSEGRDVRQPVRLGVQRE